MCRSPAEVRAWSSRSWSPQQRLPGPARISRVWEQRVPASAARCVERGDASASHPFQSHEGPTRFSCCRGGSAFPPRAPSLPVTTPHLGWVQLSERSRSGRVMLVQSKPDRLLGGERREPCTPQPRSAAV